MFEAFVNPLATSDARSVFVMDVGPVPGSTAVVDAPAELEPSAEFLAGLLQASATALNATMTAMAARRKPDGIRIGERCRTFRVEGSLSRAMEP
jgi:hypothetical protein